MQAEHSIIPAEPYPFELRPAECGLLIIDMQRDFLEPGGFGEMLGNDVSQLAPHDRTEPQLLAAWRARRLAGDPHTRGSSPRPGGPAAGQESARHAARPHRRRRPDGPHPGAWRGRATTSSRSSTPPPASR